jgi:transformer-2 protein
MYATNTASKEGGERGRSVSRSRSRSPAPRRDQPPPSRSRHPPTEPGRVLGVFSLSFETRESDLRDVFEKYGELEKVTIVYDKRSGQSRGFGFAYFVDQTSAEKAVSETNGMTLQGRTVRVDFSATAKPHDPTPGRYMGESGLRRGDDRRDGGYRRRSRSRDRRDRSRSRSRDRYYRRPPIASSHSSHSTYSRPRSPDRYRPRSRSRSVERRPYSGGSRYSPRRRSPSPRRYSRSPPPRRYSPSRR